MNGALVLALIGAGAFLGFVGVTDRPALETLRGWLSGTGSAPPRASTGGYGSASGGYAPAGQIGDFATAGAGSLDRVLRTIRLIESGGNYTAANPSSTASGAYQFLDSTWANYRGFRRAMMAPPAIQDERAAADVQKIIASGGVSAVPVVWYIGHLPSPGSSEWDTVPGGGNALTPRQYQAKWLETYAGLG